MSIVKSWGCKITSVDEILQRQARKRAGEDPMGGRPAGITRSSGAEILKVRPKVPTFGDPPVSPAAKAQYAPSSPNIGGFSLPSASSADLNANNLALHTVTAGTHCLKGSPASPADSSPPPASESISVVAKRMHAGTATSPHDGYQASEAGTEYSQLEDKPPPSFGPKTRCEWKLRQLSYSGGLPGVKKQGRGRGTCLGYAKDADSAGDGAMGGALRQRAVRHELCESLAFGGFLSMPDYAQLLADVREIVSFMEGEPWPILSQKMWTKRQVKHLCSDHGSLESRWAVFTDLVYPWPLEADGCGPHKWDPLKTKCRHMDLAPTDKLHFFVELLTEFVAVPLIAQGESAYGQLLAVLKTFADDIDTANSAADDGNNGEIFEAAMSRIRGVAALISRTYGELGSTKRDAMTIRSEGDVGMSSLYSKLTVVPFYRDLVAEYWATIDESDRCMPQVKSRLRLLGKVGSAVEFEKSVTVLEDSLLFTTDLTPVLRRTQLEKLDAALVDNVYKLADHIVVNATERPWINTQLDKLQSLFARTQDRFGHHASINGAVLALTSLAEGAHQAGATRAFFAALQRIVTYLEATDAFMSIDP